MLQPWQRPSKFLHVAFVIDMTGVANSNLRKNRGLMSESNTPETEVESSEFLVTFSVFSGDESMVELALFAFSFAAVVAFIFAAQLDMDL